MQYRTSFSSDLPPTLVRGYVQLETPANAGVSQHFPLTNANVDATKADTPVHDHGVQALGVTPPQYLGPTIAATKDGPAGSCSATCCRPARTATCSCPSTAR